MDTARSKLSDFPNHSCSLTWEDKLIPSMDHEASHHVAILHWCTKSAFRFHAVWVNSTLMIWEEDMSFNDVFYTVRWFAIKLLQRRNSFKNLLNLSSSSFSTDLMQFYLLFRWGFTYRIVLDGCLSQALLKMYLLAAYGLLWGLRHLLKGEKSTAVADIFSRMVLISSDSEIKMQREKMLK